MLSEEERSRVVEAIQKAETQTSGEIVCVIARSSGAYRSVPLAWAALAALVLPAPLIYLTIWPASVIYAAQLAAFLGLLVALSRPGLRLRIVPTRAKRERAHAEAIRQFAARGMQLTERRTGVLIFVSLAERYAEILADSGIDAKVTGDVWGKAVGNLVAQAKAGRLVDGLLQVVQQSADILAEHFPPGAIDRNELPNAVIEL